jgi:hypothetical protein
VANICVLVTALIIINQIRKATRNPLLRSSASWGSFLLGSVAQFAIALVLGETRAVRDANSILGFAVVVGVGLTLFFVSMSKRATAN